jgi:hypothetical protein
MRPVLLSCLLMLACSGPATSGGGGGGSAAGGTNNGGGSAGIGGGSAGTGGGAASSGGGTASSGGGSGSMGGGSGTGPTWYKDVLPITQVHCIACHTTGGIAPFSLETYASALPNAGAMSADVTSKKMPPWMPADGCGDFRDSRRLPQADIDTIVAWNAAGAPAGNPADAPPPPDAGPGFVADATLTPPGAYTPDSSLSDDYRCFIVDPALAADQDVVGYNIEPGQRALVHHVLLYTGPKADALTKDAQDATQGWQCFGGPGIGNPPGLLGGWAPGGGAVNYPSGTGIRLKAGDVIAMQVHYNTLAAPVAPDLTTVQLKYAAVGSVTEAALIPTLDKNFSIPPMAVNYTPPNYPVTFPTATAKLWGVLPHMHTKGVRITMQYDTQCLVDIPQWDFHWQQGYYYNQPVQLAPSVNALKLSCTWTNPTNVAVTWGETTSDEMCLGYVYVTP